MEHAPTPWKIGRESKDIIYLVGDEPDGTLGPDSNWIDCNTESNARRIVACVNACEGIETEALDDAHILIKAAANNMSAAILAEKQRDQLEKALEAIVEICNEHYSVRSYASRQTEIHSIAFAALAAVKGG